METTGSGEGEEIDTLPNYYRASTIASTIGEMQVPDDKEDSNKQQGVYENIRWHQGDGATDLEATEMQATWLSHDILKDTAVPQETGETTAETEAIGGSDFKEG